jgi:hypothetical protein
VLGCAIALAVLYPIGRALVFWGPSQLAGEPWIQTLLRGVFAMVGFILLYLCARRWQEGDDDDKRLLMWIAFAAIFVCCLSPFVAARHVMVALPAVLLLVARHTAVSFEGLERRMIGVALVIGVWLAVSDHRIAAVYRTQAAALGERLRDKGNVYFVGHWGWQFYGKQAQLRVYVPDRTVLAEGDVLIEPEGVAAQPITHADRDRLMLRETVVVPPGPVDVLRTVIDREGLYCVWKGLPWTLRTEPLERFFIYEVSPDHGAKLSAN